MLISGNGLRRAKARAAGWLRTTSPAGWCLAVLLLAAFALGGSSRSDIAPLIVLRPLAAVLLGCGLAGLTRAQLLAHWFLFAVAGAMLGWLALQLVPLPPALWHALPGRDMIAAIDQATGAGAIWRPLSMVPDGTRNALFALLVPLGVLVLAARIDSRELQRLLPLLLLIGGSSALIALVQTLSAASGLPDYYRNVDNGAAAGLFANRNHQALLLAALFPMLALSAHLAARPALKVLALVGGLPLLPLVLVTGSRSGVVCALLALLTIPLIGWERGRTVTRDKHAAGTLMHAARRAMPLTGAVVAAVLVTLTIWLGRGMAWDRLSATTPADELRVAIVPVLLSLIGTYLPVGAGAGSFPQVYQIGEPEQLLSAAYVNHAHNDWLEVVLTDGLPAAALLLAAVLAFLIAASRVWRRGQPFTPRLGFARAGLIIIGLCAVASVSDYPLRTPALSCLFVVAALWATGERPASNASSKSS